MNTEQFFSKIMDICDWDRAGNDKEILSPLIEYLSCQSDDEIYSLMISWQNYYMASTRRKTLKQPANTMTIQMILFYIRDVLR